MKNKLFFSIIIFITLFLTISAISASEIISDEDMGISDHNALSINSESGIEDNSLSIASQNEGDSPIIRDTQSEEDNNQSENLKSETELSTNKSLNQTKTSANSTNKTGIRTYLQVIDKKITYHVGSVKEIYQVRLLDVNKKPISGKKLIIKVCDKGYIAKTNTKGIATFYIGHLKKGTQAVQIYFLKSGKYLASKKTAKLIVKAQLTKDNGYWIRLDESLSTDFKKLYKTGTKQVFILSSAFKKFGEKKVLNWIKKAHAYGIKVHVWMCCFNQNGKFIAPSYKNGKININRMVFLFKKIKRFASFKLVDGIHFDYLRYPGTAHKYKNGIKAINYFVKTAVKIIRNKNPRIIISAAVMPEPSMMKYYYGQDMSALSRYLDVIIPMAYKGNYHKNNVWIKKTTQQFIKMSKGAKIWVGLQSYRSDSNINKLPYKELYNDAVSAKNGGASGVILFRMRLSQKINFKKLWS